MRRASAINLAEGLSRPVLHLPKTRKPQQHRNPDALDFGEARTELIRIAAYSRAAKRGSTRPEIDDWLAAEAQVDARLNE
jgi:hypothetical protein